MWGAHPVGHVPVSWVRKEEFPLGCQRCPDVLLTIDVLLASVNNANVACKRTRWLLLRTYPAESCPSRAIRLRIAIHSHFSQSMKGRGSPADTGEHRSCPSTHFEMPLSPHKRRRWGQVVGGDVKPLWFVIPLRKGSSLFSSTSLASVPSSIRSSLVMTPIVRKPEAATQTSNRLTSQTSNRSIAFHRTCQKQARGCVTKANMDSSARSGTAGPFSTVRGQKVLCERRRDETPRWYQNWATDC